MEKDPEITGQEGSHYTAAFWEYDSRIGRRWNVDPAYKKYPFQSNYSTFNGNPILYADPSGLWGVNKAYRKHRRANRRIESKNLNREISDVKYDKETGEYGFTISPGRSHYISSTKTKGTDFNVTPTITAYKGKFVYKNKGLDAWIPKVKFSETKVGKDLQKADEVALKETQKDISNGTYHTPNALCKSVGELTILVSGTNVIYNWTKKENIYGQEVSTGEAIKNTILLPVDLIKFVPSEVKNAGIQIGISIIGTNLTFPQKKDNE
jgi:ribosomal protein L32